MSQLMNPVGITSIAGVTIAVSSIIYTNNKIDELIKIIDKNQERIKKLEQIILRMDQNEIESESEDETDMIARRAGIFR